MRKRFGGFVAGVATTVLLGAAAVAAANGIPDTNGVFHGCVGTSTGQLRVVADDSSCRSNEAAIRWNQAGPAGAQGDQGPEGPQGPPGEAVDVDSLLALLDDLEEELGVLDSRLFYAESNLGGVWTYSLSRFDEIDSHFNVIDAEVTYFHNLGIETRLDDNETALTNHETRLQTLELNASVE